MIHMNLRILVFLWAVFMPFLADCQSDERYPVRYEPGTLIGKLRPENRDAVREGIPHSPALIPILNTLSCTRMRQVFPKHTLPTEGLRPYRKKQVDLSLIYEIRYDSGIPQHKAISALLSTGLFTYVEPRYCMEPMYVPNDDKFSQQYYLQTIHAPEAWDSCKGDSTVVIGIVDSGTDWDHEDLLPKLAWNIHDPVDGIDNDNDTYIDNYMGWDLGENDNNPQVAPGGGNSSHGVHISGLAAAATDNLSGIAGTGFYCRYLPVKVADADGNFSRPFEGIVYAADHGCQIINCSWGAPYTAGQFGQDIIDYAMVNRGALVIASAGNSGNDIRYFPASYPGVLSVAATDANDARMWVSSTYATNYGTRIDVCVPGQNILSTWDYPYFYKSLSGTSMACGIASGAAGLLRSRFPNDNPWQTAERLRVCSDRIDTLPINAGFEDLLGMGRINLAKALTLNNLSALRIKSWRWLPDGVNPQAGDTLNLEVVYVNHLANASNAIVEMSTPDTAVVLLNAVSPAFGLNSGDTIVLTFRLMLKPTFYPSFIDLKFTATDPDHQVFEWIHTDPVRDYLNLENGQLTTSLTGKGKIGYNDALHEQGRGFCFHSPVSWLYSGGFLLGTGYTAVSDALYNANNTGYDQDFKNELPVAFLPSPLLADQESFTRFNDSLAEPLPLKVGVSQRSLTWADPEDEDFVILEYSVENRGSLPLTNLYAGIFLDWDMDMFHSTDNHVEWDPEMRMGYAFQDGGWPLAGLALLSDAPVRHYAFDMDGSDGSIKVYDGFTSTEKYNALKGGRNRAGISGTGNDIADLVSSGPYNLPAGDTLKLAWVITAGYFKEALDQNVLRARLRYAQTPGFAEDIQNVQINLFPNPVKEELSLMISPRPVSGVRIKISSIEGLLLKQMERSCPPDGLIRHPVGDLAPGVYLLEIQTGQARTGRRFVVY